MAEILTPEQFPDVRVGDRIRFTPDGHARRWWTVAARDDDHVVAVRQAPFEPKGVLQYTVTEVRDYKYNGVGPGLVRSSLNILGGGWDIDPARVNEDCKGILTALRRDVWQLSNRRLVLVNRIEVDRG